MYWLLALMEEKSSEISQNKMQSLKTQSFALPVQQILPENFEKEYSVTVR